MNNHLQNIDKLIEEQYSKDSKFYIEDLSKLIQEFFEIDFKRNHTDFLFNKENNEKNLQRFISFCFIRVLASKNYEHVVELKHSIFKFITWSVPDVVQIIGISDRTETYEKEKKIKEFIDGLEKEFFEQCFFDGVINNLNKFQQDFRRFITHRKNSMFREFTLDLFSKTSIDSIFNKLNEYLNATEINKYEIYSSLKETLDQFVDDANKISTKYSIGIAKCFEKISMIILKDIEKSPYFIPTYLKILKTEKKYPLIKGVKSNFNIVITNLGKGIAKDVNLSIVDYDVKNIYIPKTDLNIGNVAFENVMVEFDYEVINNSNSLLLEIQLSWSSSINQQSQQAEIIELQSQTINIDWDKIKTLEPYNLEPVENEPELIGRESILQKLRNMQSLPIGSAYVYGQRRVGKTSIVKTLLSSNSDKNLLIYYIEAGDWNDAHSASSSMTNLAEKICKKIKRYNAKFSSVPIPDFNGSFNKITDFLDEVEDIDKHFKLVIILDEFDRISRNLYERGDVGQAFLLTLRSISNRPQFGFILVGGEKLEYILSQWQEFNKFSPVRVDYFSKERDWDDFKKLIQKPVENILEITDAAINYIHEETAGNPYFTKKICMELFTMMVNNRDIHVTANESYRATKIAQDSANIGATDFSHFWEDGIKGKVEKEEETSLKRRKILISITHVIKAKKTINKANVSDFGMELGLNSTDSEKYLTEFEQRKILKSQDNEYLFIVNFFKEWLISGGMEKIIATFEEEERVQLYQKIEESTKVKSEEIIKLLPKLRIYKGHDIKTENLRNWLDQFSDVFDQRLAFKLLENFKLYTEAEVRERMESLFIQIKRELNKRGSVRTIDTSRKKRDDILVTYLDKSPAKGATYFTKLFVDENGIYSDNVFTPDLIEKRINDKKNLNCLIIIDDFVGSGQTMVDNINNYFTEEVTKLISERGIVVIIGVISGFLKAKEYIEEKLKFLNIDFKIIIVDLLSDSDKCFNSGSTIFANPSEMKKAKNLTEQKGKFLVAKNPLGFSDGQCLIAFPMNCPNNTLPIFWKRSDNWIPLFERN